MKEEIKVAIRLAEHGIKGYNESAIAQGESNDCFVRTVAAAAEVDYDTAHAYVAEKYGRKNRQGTYGVASGLRKRKELLGKTVEELGEDITPWPGRSTCGKRLVMRYKCYGKIVEREMTFKSFLKKHPEGTYIMLVKDHAFCLKDGVVVGGNIQDTQALRKRIHSAFRIL
jgi:hypothetical protein